ncbi:PTPLA-domain-containing protein [Auricularia subglabra TFB-10046 SS5]|nr:PTPLA-domain-containing protein [Auricularia subglabra TFB-10046 SS5]
MSSRRSKQAAVAEPPVVPEKTTVAFPPPLTAPITKKGNSQIVAYYLVAYNVLSTLAWAYILVATSAHLLGMTQTAKVVTPTQTATTLLSRLLAKVPILRPAAPVSAQIQSRVPPALLPLLNRAKTTYVAVGLQTTVVQSFALLELLHAYLGWVRSPLGTTAMQVSSRLTLVWYIAEHFESARSSPFFASMVLSWAVTEVIRYSFYATGLLRATPTWLTWLRYSTFYVLYPTGAGSEAFTMFATLPPVPSKIPILNRFQQWAVGDYFRAVLFIIWWPALYVLYTYMIRQRRKVLGSSHKLKAA